jgi:2-aminoadipate transaminase
MVCGLVGDRRMDVEALEGLLAYKRPKLIYVVPNFQNPTGATLSIERRYALTTCRGPRF